MIAVNVAVANDCAVHRMADLFVMAVKPIVLIMLICVNPFCTGSCNVLISQLLSTFPFASSHQLLGKLAIRREWIVLLLQKGKA